MKTRLLFVPLLLALVASLAACGGGGGGVPANAVAVVNGTPITTAQFNTWLNAASALATKQTGTTPQPGSTQYTSIRAGTVARLVEFAEVKQAAAKLGISVTPSEVSKYITDIAKARFGGSTAKLLAYYKLTLPMAQQEAADTLLQQKLHAKVTASAKVTPKEEQAYYTAHRAQYILPAATTRSLEFMVVKKKSLADKIERELKNGTSFAKLAKKYSFDASSAAQGGKYTATGVEVPAFDRAAFALKTGKLSTPIDATSAANRSTGWFIMRPLGPVVHKKAHTGSFQEEEASIHQALLQQAQYTLWQQYIADFMKSYNGKIKYQAGYAPPATTALPATTG